MTQTEAARWQTLLIGGTLGVCAEVPGGVGICRERCYKWMKDITLECNYWRLVRVVVREIYLEA